MIGFRVVVEHRLVINLALGTVAGVIGPTCLPIDQNNPLLMLIARQRPVVFAILTHGYVAMWCSTAFLFFTVLTTVLYILFGRGEAQQPVGPLPPYPAISSRRAPFIVLGEQHYQAPRAASVD